MELARSPHESGDIPQALPQRLLFLYCLVPAALLSSKRSENNGIEDILSPGDQLGQRLLTLDISFERDTDLSETFCTQRMAFDRYIWAQPARKLQTEQAVFAPADKPADSKIVLFRLEFLDEVYVLAGADRRWIANTGDRNYRTPMRTQAKRAATLLPITDTQTWQYSSPVVLLRRRITAAEITQII